MDRQTDFAVELSHAEKPLTFSFVSDDRPHPVNMCLIPNAINENEVSGTIVGQLFIDDSSSPLLSCSKQHCCPGPQSSGKHFDYQCHVDIPESNEAIPQLQKNVSALFRLDDGFLLRTRVPLLYSDFKDSNGSVQIHFSCYDTKHPLHFIGQSLQVIVAGEDANGVCTVCEPARHASHARQVSQNSLIPK